MNAIIMSSESLSSLGLFLEAAFLLAGMLLAVIAGAVLAWKLAPIDASESEVMAQYDVYCATQQKLAALREKRKQQYVEGITRALKRVREMDDTIPTDCPEFAVVPCTTVVLQ